MSFYYVKSEADQSPTSSSLLHPFGGNQEDFLNPMGSSPTYFGQTTFLRSTSFSDQIWADRFNDEVLNEQAALGPSYGSSDSCDGNSESSEGIPGSDYESIFSTPCLSDEDYDRLEKERPWEKIAADEINCVPVEFEDFLKASIDGATLRLGPFKALLRYYILQAVDEMALSRENRQDVRSSLTYRITNSDLAKYAKAAGLLPLVIRLHLEFTGRIPVGPERSQLLLFRKEKRRRAKIAAAGQGPQLPILDSENIKYFPGIELKLGKERDTIIRPMVTSVFRSNREAFRSALLGEGLKYGELRMWKDAQLCTALHVADSFRPGIWAKAVELHAKKVSRPSRVRKSIQKG